MYTFSIELGSSGIYSNFRGVILAIYSIDFEIHQRYDIGEVKEISCTLKKEY